MSESGDQITGQVWVDASYEGDLAAIAGASMTWGREPAEQYNETGAGRQPASITYDVNPYWSDGSLISYVSDQQLAAVGAGDSRVEAYTFRLCMTDSPGHRIPIWKPKNYNGSDWEFWRRLYRSKPPTTLAEAGLGCLGPVPNSYADCGARACVKCDMLGMQHGTDLLNGAWGYPNGSASERRAIRRAHIDYISGLLWFWATDPAVGSELHAEMNSIGHCSDEYGAPQSFAEDPAHWPYQLYVREAKRLQGEFIWTEHEPPARLLARGVGLGAYTFDCHWCSLYASTVGGKAVVSAEGRVNNGHDGSKVPGVAQPAYKVPYDVLLPRSEELTNVLVPVACSSSHVRYNAVRMEPSWAVQAHAAGSAAAMALLAGTSVHDVDVSALQKLLVTQKQKLEP